MTVVSPAELAIVALAFVSGVVAYVAAERRTRFIALAGLSLAAALVALRHAGTAPAGAAAAVGLAIASLDALGAGDARSPSESRGLRLLTVGFAALAALALAVNRPLGVNGALDANAIWYWLAALGILTLLGDAGGPARARGGALLVAGAALATALLVPEPAPATYALAASGPVAIAAASALRAWPGATLAAVAVAFCGLGLHPAEAHYALEPTPSLGRVALVLLVLCVAAGSAVAPLHLWAGELVAGSPGRGALLLGVASALGALTLSTALVTNPWVLGVVGARSLIETVGVVTLVLGAFGLFAERAPARFVLQVSQLPAGLAWLGLAVGQGDSEGTAAETLLIRAAALTLAFVGAWATLRWPPHRPLTTATAPFWLGLLALLAVSVRQLDAIAPARPALAIAGLVLLALALYGVRRCADALAAHPATS